MTPWPVSISGRAPLFERFVLGTSSTLRGWNKFDIDPLGGDRMVHNTLEYRYRMLEVFYDTGAVWNRGQAGRGAARRGRRPAPGRFLPGRGIPRPGEPGRTGLHGGHELLRKRESSDTISRRNWLMARLAIRVSGAFAPPRPSPSPGTVTPSTSSPRSFISSAASRSSASRTAPR